MAKLIDKGWSRYQLANKYNYPNGAMYNIVGRYKKHGLEGILYDKSNLQRITLQTNEMIEKEINQVRDIELECYKYVFSLNLAFRAKKEMT